MWYALFSECHVDFWVGYAKYTLEKWFAIFNFTYFQIMNAIDVFI